MTYRLRRAIEAALFCLAITLVVQGLIEWIGLIPALVAVNLFFAALAASKAPPKEDEE